MDDDPDLERFTRNYDRDGFVSGVPILNAAAAARHRAALEAA